MIPGVATFHAREVWVDPRYPITGPLDNPANNDTVVIHYTAADDLIDGDPGEHAEDLPAYMRAMQKAYAKPVAEGGRGYSLGYLFAVDWLGGVWQIRGWEFQSAANAGHNDHTWPVLVLVDGADGATDEAAASIRAIAAEAERRAGRKQAIKGHGQLRLETGVGTATACPGVGLQAQINAGLFAPVIVRPPDPQPPQPPEGDVDMILVKYDRGGGKWTGLTYTGAHLAHVTTSDAWSIPVSAGAPVVDVNDTQLDALIRSAQTTNACPPEWVNTARGAAWNAQRG